MHYAPTAALPCFLLVHSALSPCPLPIPPSHISEFPLIRILRVNPSYSSFHSGLAFSPLAKRTIAWERQDKRPPCWWCAVLDPQACFSLLFTLFFPLWQRQTVTHPPCLSVFSCRFIPDLHVCRVPTALSSSHYTTHTTHVKMYALLTSYWSLYRGYI